MIVGNITSYDVPENAVDLSRAFYMMNLPSTPLLNAIEVDGVARDTTHKWWDDKLLPIGTTLGASYTAASSNLTVANAKGLRAGSIFRIEGTVFRADAVDYETNVITVSVLNGDADHVNGAKVDFMGNARLENSERQDSDYTPPVRRQNVTQILDDSVDFSGTELVIDKEINSSSNLSSQVDKKLQRLYLALGRMIWNNWLYDPATKDEARVMAGLDYFITQNGYIPSPATFNEDNFDIFILELTQERGLENPEIWINPLQMALFTKLGEDKVVRAPLDTVRGTPPVRKYLTKYGHELAIRNDANKRPGTIDVFETRFIKLMPLNKRSFFLKNKDDDRDGESRRIIGEYTLRIHNSNSFGRFTPLI